MCDNDYDSGDYDESEGDDDTANPFDVYSPNINGVNADGKPFDSDDTDDDLNVDNDAAQSADPEVIAEALQTILDEWLPPVKQMEVNTLLGKLRDIAMAFKTYDPLIVCRRSEANISTVVNSNSDTESEASSGSNADENLDRDEPSDLSDNESDDNRSDGNSENGRDDSKPGGDRYIAPFELPAERLLELQLNWWYEPLPPEFDLQSGDRMKILCDEYIYYPRVGSLTERSQMLESMFDLLPVEHHEEQHDENCDQLARLLRETVSQQNEHDGVYDNALGCYINPDHKDALAYTREYWHQYQEGGGDIINPEWVSDDYSQAKIFYLKCQDDETYRDEC